MLTFCAAGCSTNRAAPALPGKGLELLSLDYVTVERLRQRPYGTTIQPALRTDGGTGNTFLAKYDSDGLNVITRIDVPHTRAAENGYPVLVFLHGWVGIEMAPEFDFHLTGDSWYDEIIDRYVAAGYIVLTPGFRGHGGADGIEYLEAWDNGSYLSPVFYAVDVLNLIDGLETLPPALDAMARIELDLNRICVVGHSQGGDVALITAAVAGENSAVRHDIAAVSIWSGTFPSRLTQLRTYYPMQTTREAFVAGDNTWNSSAVGQQGEINPNFIFGYPPDWIGTPDESSWTWQNDAWSLESVADAWGVKLAEMYGTVNARIADIGNASYSIDTDDSGVSQILHDERLAAAIERVGAFHLPEYLTERLTLHFSDRDFYSLPGWNRDLCSRVNASGGDCVAWEYFGTNHSLRVSEHRWFSPSGTADGFGPAVSRDLRRFETAVSGAAR